MKHAGYAGVLLLALILLSFGCPTTQNPPPENEQITYVSVTGTIADTGAVYLVVITDCTTGLTYSGDTDENGNFSVQVPKDHSYIVAVVDDTGRTAAVLAYDQPDAATRSVEDEVVTGLAVDESTALGSLQLPAEPGVVMVQTPVDIDIAIVAKVDTEAELIGFGDNGNFGKGLDTILADPLLDPKGGKADPDGDGILDDWDPTPYGTFSPDKSSAEFSIGFLLDIRENSGVRSYDSVDPVKIEENLQRDMRLDFRLRYRDTAKFAAVASVRLYVPSSPVYAVHLDAVEFARDGEAWAEYTLADESKFRPAVNPMQWADFKTGVDGYNIPKHLNDPNTFAISTKIPVGRLGELFAVGDVWTVEVVYDDGTVEYYSAMINYIFDTPTHFTHYDTSSSSEPSTSLEDYTALDFSDDTNLMAYETGDTYLHFAFIPPTDDTGSYIVPYDGASYNEFRIQLFASDDSAKTVPVGSSEPGWNPNQDYYLSDEVITKIAGIDEHRLGSVPILYIENLTDEMHPQFDMEYFLSVSEGSQIKNRLHFQMSEAP